MRRVDANGLWSLMCPHMCPGLCDVYGEDFDRLYEQYEREGKYVRQVKAQMLWFAILESQIETGTPYILFKDACNAKSNQKNLGTIRSSNLCTEIIEYSSDKEVAVCNLASIAVNAFYKEGGKYDYDGLETVVRQLVRNLNQIIDHNYYPLPETKESNLKHRPIGIGIQGLQDLFFLMRYPFDSGEAQALNRDIFESIYYAALSESNELAKVHGPYESFQVRHCRCLLYFSCFASLTQKNTGSRHPRECFSTICGG